jgi:hypothetical protein
MKTGRVGKNFGASAAAAVVRLEGHTVRPAVFRAPVAPSAEAAALGDTVAAVEEIAPTPVSAARCGGAGAAAAAEAALRGAVAAEKAAAAKRIRNLRVFAVLLVAIAVAALAANVVAALRASAAATRRSAAGLASR